MTDENEEVDGEEVADTDEEDGDDAE